VARAGKTGWGRLVPMADPSPVLVACSHGTADPAGQRELERLRAAVAAARPGVRVLAAYVDVQQPTVAEVVRGLADGGRSGVVVPLLLSAGYHVQVDVAGAVEASAGHAVAAEPLGPDGVLVRVLAQRLAEAGRDPGDTVILAAAGSSDPRSTADVERVARGLGELLGASVRAGYLSAARPAVDDVVAEARARGHGVTVACYLLAPGHLHSRLAGLDADRVSAPLLPHPSLTDLVLRRYDAAAARLSPRPCG
jgi:sirohydrochlorin ferrochelatase